MSQPTKYSKGTNFADYAASHAAAPFPPASVDSELAAIEQTTDEICDNLALIQRDDGLLKNGSVSPDTLSSAALLLIGNWNVRGNWLTATVYAVKDFVQSNGFGYVCLVAHTSGTFATDLAAGKWTQVDVTSVALAASTGAGLIGWIQAGVGAVLRLLRDKLRDRVHIKDYGALCDGTGDDAADIMKCVNANPGRTIVFSGTPRIKSKLTQGLHQKWVADGARGTTNTDLPGCYLIKDATFTGDVAVSLQSPGGAIGIGLLLENGSTGGGFEIIGHAAGGAELQVIGAGTAGSNGTAYRIGNTAGTNTNSPWLWRCLAYGAGINHGVHLHDGSGGAPNVNFGKIELFEALLCNGDGVRNENANGTVIDTVTGETCVGIGCHIVDGDDVHIKSSDLEGNIAGQVQIEEAANRTLVDLAPDAVVVDLSETTIRHDLYQSKGTDAQFLITGSTTTTKAIAGITRSGTTVSFNIVGHTFIVGDTFAVVGSESGVLQRFSGGYKVATVTDANNITATVTADRASKLPLSQGNVGALAIVGYAASTQAGWWSYLNGIVTFGGHIVNNNIAANVLMSGAGCIRGLPMPARAATGEQSGVQIFFGDGVTFPASTLYPGGAVLTGDYKVTIVFGKSGAANVTAAIGAGGISQTADITFGGSYRAA